MTRARRFKLAAILASVTIPATLITTPAFGATAADSQPTASSVERADKCVDGAGHLEDSCIQYVKIAGDGSDSVERALAYTVEHSGIEKAQRWVDNLDEPGRATTAQSLLDQFESSSDAVESALDLGQDSGEPATAAPTSVQSTFASEYQPVVFGMCDETSCWDITTITMQIFLDGTFAPELTLSGTFESSNSETFKVTAFDCVTKHSLWPLPDTVMYNWPNCKPGTTTLSWYTVEAGSWSQAANPGNIYYMEYALTLQLGNYPYLDWSVDGWRPNGAGITWGYSDSGSKYPEFY